jgi:hypothetical protein
VTRYIKKENALIYAIQDEENLIPIALDLEANCATGALVAEDK